MNTRDGTRRGHPFLRRLRSYFAPSMHVVVDATRLGSGGQNGGIKPFLLKLVQTATALDARLRWTWLLSTGMAQEAAGILGHRDKAIIIAESENVCFEDVRFADCIRVQANFCAADLKELSPDLLYAPFGHSNFHTSQVPLLPLVVDLLHRELPDYLPPEEVAHRERFYQEALPQAQRIQVISHYVSSCVQRHFHISAKKCLVTPICVHARLQAQVGRAPKHFLYPANFWPHKNHELLLLAYRIHRQRNPGTYRLVLTGHRDDRSAHLERVTASLGLTPHVDFTGHLELEAFNRIWAETAGLIFPSLHEGFGIPVIEAMHQGVPVACSNVTALPEVAGDAAVLFDPRDPAAIADSFDALLQPELRQSLVRLGRQRLAQLDENAIAATFVATLRELAS